MKTLKDYNYNHLLIKWSKMGCLESANDPKIMAYCLDYSCRVLLKSSISKHNGMIIPIIFRVINKINPTSRHVSRGIAKDIIEKFPRFMERNRGIISDLMYYQNIDWEVEMCQLFADDYLLIYENNRTIQ